MSSQKYRKLLTNLPSMSAVVNSFQSQEVQLEVYRILMTELEEATEETVSSGRKSATSRQLATEDDSQAELAHALVDGESIHVDDDLEA